MPRWSPFATETDRALAVGLTDNGDGALDALYDAYAGRLYDYVLSLTGEPRPAADIVHDVFIDAARRAPRMRDHRDLRCWLYGAARRRIEQHGRAAVPYWEPDAEFSPVSAPVPPAELRDLLDGTLGRLDPAVQEALLLALRHGLTGDELAHVWGVAPRRAEGRFTEARAALAEAFAGERAQAVERCAALLTPEDVTRSSEGTFAAVGAGTRNGPAGGLSGDVLPGGPPVERTARERHLAACAGCRARAEIPVAELLSAAPSPVLPAALRHRVLHTATDPELAAYRADIAARGGALSPEGMPLQPDVPSPFTRRWLFTAGGMAGALATALVAALLIGLPPSIVYFNGEPAPTPVINRTPTPGALRERPDPRATGGDVPVVPHHDGNGSPAPTVPGTPGSPGAPPSTAPPPTSPAPTTPGPGTMLVSPLKVELDGWKRKAKVTVTAHRGPVGWRVVSSSDKVTVSQESGDLGTGDSGALTVTLRSTLLNPQGRAELTFLDETGAERKVEVVWAPTLL